MWIAAHAVARDAARIATEQPALWREIRRFNLPVKLALAAAHQVAAAFADPKTALLVGLAPCRPGSPELHKITRDLDLAFDDPSRAEKLRVNPIYTLHAVDNLGLSALSLALGNQARSANLGGAAGQAWAALEHVLEQRVPEALVFGGDQSEASWLGTADPDNELAAAVALRAERGDARARLVAIERAAKDHDEAGTRPHAARGLAAWLEALVSAPAGPFAYEVPARDGDGIDAITVIAEVMS